MSAFDIDAASAVVIIDMQYDFIAGGALAVNGGDAIVGGINDCVKTFSKKDATIVFTQDWHPRGHVSFASSHPKKKPYDEISGVPGAGPVLWPDHCMAGTHGARLHRKLKVDLAHLIMRKGYHQEIDSYSAFMENDKKTSTGLAGFLKEHGISKVFLCGLAFDYCVYYSALDGVAAGFKTWVFEDLTRAVDSPAGRAASARKDLQAKGCKLVAYKR
ncbi:MAG: bifunctional nicotinamidase/pyrazinamidase [Candidatus Lokiarchaeota archaeon]|nr:bifunctional nicotinamidase/pyrazinamidase [Candidatus Lokiarchaeota archaeon]